MAQILKTLSRCFITFETEQQYVDTYKKDLVDTYYQQYSTKDAPCKMGEDMLRLEYQRQKLLKSEKFWSQLSKVLYGILVASWVLFTIVGICETI